MHQFKDSEGRTWNLKFTLESQQSVYSLHSVDIRDHEILQRFASDPKFRWDVIFTILEEQITAAGLTAVELAKSLAPDDLDGMETKATDALLDFFRPGPRETMKKAWEMAQTRAPQNAKKMEAVLTKTLEEMDATANKAMDAILAGTTIGNSSGSAPAQSA